MKRRKKNETWWRLTMRLPPEFKKQVEARVARREADTAVAWVIAAVRERLGAA